MRGSTWCRGPAEGRCSWSSKPRSLPCSSRPRKDPPTGSRAPCSGSGTPGAEAAEVSGHRGGPLRYNGGSMSRSGAVLLLFLAACSSVPREDVEPLFHALEHGGAAEAMAAGEKLAAVYDDRDLPRLTKALDAAPVRALQLLGELSTDGSALLLLDRLSYLLESTDRQAP